VTEERSVFERLKARGEEVLGQVTNELMSSPQFARAVESAMKGKQKLDRAVGQALKQMNIPTRSEFKRALGRIETLEAQLASLQARAKPRAGGRAGKARKRPAAAKTPAE
jgi:polyhydroxyalkanoate synthesis regulator phasin